MQQLPMYLTQRFGALCPSRRLGIPGRVEADAKVPVHLANFVKFHFKGETVHERFV